MNVKDIRIKIKSLKIKCTLAALKIFKGEFH